MKVRQKRIIAATEAIATSKSSSEIFFLRVSMGDKLLSSFVEAEVDVSHRSITGLPNSGGPVVNFVEEYVWNSRFSEGRVVLPEAWSCQV